MKTIEVVAAIIHQDGKILATQRDTATLRTVGNFRAARLSRGKPLERRLSEKSKKNWP